MTKNFMNIQIVGPAGHRRWAAASVIKFDVGLYRARVVFSLPSAGDPSGRPKAGAFGAVFNTHARAVAWTRAQIAALEDR